MNGPKVFVSFDYDNDRRYKYLLEAWSANSRFSFVFRDATPDEINSYNISRIKATLTAKIKSADYTLVIIGKYSNSYHKDYKLISFRNWINFEIYQSKMNDNKIIAVKLDSTYDSPEEIKGANASWAMSFTEEAITKALNQA